VDVKSEVKIEESRSSVERDSLMASSDMGGRCMGGRCMGGRCMGGRCMGGGVWVRMYGWRVEGRKIFSPLANQIAYLDHDKVRA
jgi:hypothetical protein